LGGISFSLSRNKGHPTQIGSSIEKSAILITAVILSRDVEARRVIPAQTRNILTTKVSKTNKTTSESFVRE
jgi:hypothetical protein